MIKPNSVGSQRRTLANIKLFIDDLLDNDIPISKQHSDIQQQIIRYIGTLKTIFLFYCKYGVAPEVVNVAESHSRSLDGNRSEVRKTLLKLSKNYELSMIQFWKFAKDCNLISINRLTFASIDRIFVASKNSKFNLLKKESSFNQSRTNTLPPLNQSDSSFSETPAHNPDNKMRFREFVEAIVRIALMLSVEQLSVPNKHLFE